MFSVTDLKEFKKGLLGERTDDWVDPVPVECIHTLHITTTVIHLTSQLQTMNIDQIKTQLAYQGDGNFYVYMYNSCMWYLNLQQA